jgi:hypothetical protein
MIDRCAHTFAPSTMCTAEERAVGLDPVPNDPAAAVIAHGRELLNRALEAIEDVPFLGGNYLE